MKKRWALALTAALFLQTGIASAVEIALIEETPAAEELQVIDILELQDVFETEKTDEVNAEETANVIQEDMTAPGEDALILDFADPAGETDDLLSDSFDLWAEDIQEIEVPEEEITTEALDALAEEAVNLSEQEERISSILDAEELADPSDEVESDTTYTDVESAAAFVRKYAKQRTAKITVHVNLDVYNKLCEDALGPVMRHTGNPTEGDYLRSNILGSSLTYGSGFEDAVIIYEFQYFTNASQEAQVDQAVGKLVTELGLKNTAKSDYDKILAVYQWITKNVRYDWEGYENGNHPDMYSTYAAIIKKQAVCQGYTSLFYRLMLESGIDARIIDSDYRGHAWNIVRLTGKYYLMDCTWDEAETNPAKNVSDYGFFLRGKQDFLDHNNPDDQFQDAAFAAAYPLADLAYISALGTMPGTKASTKYSFASLDGKQVSNLAENGKAKLVFFYLPSCMNAINLASTLVGETIPKNVDVVFVRIDTGAEDLIQKQFAPMPGVQFCFGDNTTQALRSMMIESGLLDPKAMTYMIESPTVFLLNKNNEYIYAKANASYPLPVLMSYSGMTVPNVNNGTNAVPAKPATAVKPAAKPAPAVITSAKNSASRTITVKWKRVKGVKGYEIRYKQGKQTKIVQIKKASKTSVKLKKLKVGKKYKINIRTYKMVNGKKICSSWSKAKSVKIRR